MGKISISLCSPNTFDNVLLNENAEFTTEQEALLISDDHSNGYFQLQWEDFPDALVLCNFLTTDGIISTSSPVGAIKGYQVQRLKYGDTYWTTIYDNDKLITDGSVTYNTYIVYDYNIENNTNYTYRLCPLTLNGQGVFEDKKMILNDWDSFTLTPLVVSTDTYNSDLKVATPVIVDSKPQIWKFVANCEEGALTKVQDKTYMNNFTQFPKVSIGKMSYYTIPFSGLLGSIDEDLNYYEPSNVLEQWNEFLDKGYICLYKNLKGDARIVSIDSNSTVDYANEYNAFFPQSLSVTEFEKQLNSDGTYTPQYITNRPTTISLNLTEIDDKDNYRIIRLVGES